MDIEETAERKRQISALEKDREQAKLHILCENLLVHPSVILKHEGIVGVGYDEDVEYPSLH